jgi:hypothetical protein
MLAGLIGYFVPGGWDGPNEVETIMNVRQFEQKL